MSESVEDDCPLCNTSMETKEKIATAKIAEHIKEKARRDQSHKEWVENHTGTGSVSEIRAALDEHDSPRTD